MPDLIPVILSGGSGTRLWPLSRTHRPKQFIDVTEGATLFQLTLRRLAGLGAGAPVIVANQDHRFLAGEQCRQAGIEPRSIILEPLARNTAPAIAAAALTLASDPGLDEPVLLVLPSDHVIADLQAFEQAVEVGHAAARAGKLVTFGVEPTRAEVGYGYVKVSGQLAAGTAAPVQQFVEKPSPQIAEAYLLEGGYFWNSGMFMFQASRFLAELERLQPALYAASALAVSRAARDLEFIRLDKDAFAACPSDSIDYAVMEKTESAVLVPLNAGWSDVGAWSAVSSLQSQDEHGNASRGDVILEATRNCYAHSSQRLVALLGVEDLIVIETSDAVLVAQKDRSQDVKRLVDRLKTKGRNEVVHHREVYRPWGSYDSVDAGERFQVKRIIVKPGAKLSVQMHHHRAEHWVVVSGTATVRIGDVERLVTENESVYIPLGVVHSLENPGKVPLHLVEVQSGSYLGEDDIVRFEDRYGRA